MTKNETTIRFEALDIDPGLSGDLALLVMETKESGRVAVHMQRPVFVALFERMRLALEQSNEPSQPQSDT